MKTISRLRRRDGERLSALQQIKRSRESYLLLAPFMLLFLFLTVIPMISAIGLSFTNFNMLETPRFVGWQNYQRMLLGDPIFYKVVKNTLVFAFLTGPVSYILSFLFAWLINETGRRMRTFLTLIFYLPVLSGNVYFIWAFLFSSDSYGVINGLLMSMNIIQEPVGWLINQNTIMAVLIVVQLWMSLGTGFLTFVAGFQGMDNSLFEAGAIDGVRNRWQELWYITLPMIKPQMMFSAVMSITSAFNVGTLITALCGYPTVDYAAHTIMNHLTDYGTIRFEMGYASAIATLLFLMMVGANLLAQRLIAKVGE